MRSIKANQSGLIPILVFLLLIMIGVIVLVFLRVQNAQNGI